MNTMMISITASRNAILFCRLHAGRGAAVRLERTVVAAVFGPQRRLLVGAQYPAFVVRSGSTTSFAPCLRQAVPMLALNIALSGKSCILYPACHVLPSRKVLLNPASFCSPLSLSRQVVEFQGQRCWLYFCACLEILLARAKLMLEIREIAARKINSKSIRSKLMSKLMRDVQANVQERETRKAQQIRFMQEIKSLIKKAHVKRQSRQDKKDRSAIEDYTNNWYGVINRALRGGNPTVEEQQRIDAVTRALFSIESSSHTRELYIVVQCFLLKCKDHCSPAEPSVTVPF